MNKNNRESFNLKFLVVGLGSMGKRRIRNLQKLGYNNIIGFDKRIDRQKEAKKLYGVKIFSNIQDALIEKPNMMIISTPPNLHLDYVKLALKHKIHFFTELNLLYNDVKVIIRKLKKQKTIGCPSFTMQNHPITKKLKQLIKTKTIGNILLVNHHTGHYLPIWHPWEKLDDFFVSQKDTGGAKELIAADLVWILHIFPKVNIVTGNVKKISNLKIKSDDVYQANLELSNGIFCNLLIDVITFPSSKITEIIGERGTIVCDFTSGRITIKKKNFSKNISVEMGQVAKGYAGITPPETLYEDEMSAFINTVTNKKKYPYSFKDELDLLLVIKTIENSSRLGKKISIRY